MKETITFDSFVPNAAIGSFTEIADEKMVQLWRRLYPMDTADPDQLPRGLATVLLMRAYMHILTPRPPGNIHAGQYFEMIAPVALNEPVSTELSCVSKELRRGRRYVELASHSRGSQGRPLFSGRMKLIWAA